MSVNLLRNIGRAYHAVADNFWTIGRNGPQRPQRTPRWVRRPLIRQPRRPIPDQLSGPEILDLFGEIYNCVQETKRSEGKLQQLDTEIRRYQQREDLAAAGVVRLRSLRADHELFLEKLEGIREDAASKKVGVLVTRLNLMKDVTEQKNRLARNWQKLDQHAQVYFDSCFKAEFSEPWSLCEAGFTDLRKTLDLFQLSERRKAHLRTLRFKRLVTRNAQWRAERAIKNAPQALSDALGAGLDEIRTAEFAREIGDVEKELSSLENEVADGGAVIENLLCRMVDQRFEELLKAAGRCVPQDKAVSEPGRRDAESPRSEDARSQRSESYELSPLEEFEDARDFLEEEQKLVSLNRARRLGAEARATQAMTFTPDPALLAAREAIRLQRESDALQKAEDDFESARNRLLASGGEIPTTPPPQEKPLGGGLNRDARPPPGSANRSLPGSPDDSDRIRYTNRRGLNNWRFRAQGDAISMTAVTKRSESDWSSGWSRPRTRTGTPSPGRPSRQQKLRDYVQQQEQMREAGMNVLGQ